MSASTLILGPVRDAGVGARTAEELDIRLPRLMATPGTVGGQGRDRVLPGPGRTLRAVMDRFPGVGPRMNRLSGAEGTMVTVAELREQQRAAQHA